MTWQQRRFSKYNNVRQDYNGVFYDSKAEAARAMELDLLVKGKAIKSWERQRKISLDVNGYHIANYYIDFVIHENDGTETWEEVKGFATEVWRLKWKLCEALYGDDENVKLVVLKQ